MADIYCQPIRSHREMSCHSWWLLKQYRGEDDPQHCLEREKMYSISEPRVYESRPRQLSVVLFSMSAFGLCLTLPCLPLHIHVHVQDLIMYMYMLS